MTLQWTFVASVLYAEIFIVCILLLPFISPKTWQKLFRSNFVSWLSTYSKIYFYVFIAILVLLFAESMREVQKYSAPIDVKEQHSPVAETYQQMKMFRAQRNLYISGMALFLWFILRRLVILIANEAILMAESEASRKQAQGAVAAAQAMLDDKTLAADNSKNEKKADKKGEGSATDPKSSAVKDLAKTQAELEKTKEELYKANVQFESMKKQAESVNREYDRLLLEHEKLQNQLAAGGADKKAD